MVSRQIVQGIPSLESLFRAPLIIDIDDAVWLANPLGKASAIHAARCAAVVVAGNTYLAEWHAKYASRVEVVPTSIDTTRYYSDPAARDGSAFVIGWTGTQSNLTYLEALEPALKRFVDRHDEARILVIGDAPPNFRAIAPDRVEFVRWTAELEAPTVRRMNVGLMPLDDDPWTRGKCAAKMLQYMGSGVPVIVSPVGANLEVLAHGDVGWGPESMDDWFDALEECYGSPSVAEAKGRRGRRVVESSYSVAVSAQKLAAIFRSVV